MPSLLRPRASRVRRRPSVSIVRWRVDVVDQEEKKDFLVEGSGEEMEESSSDVEDGLEEKVVVGGRE